MSANHPEIANARNGVVEPGNVNSTMSEETHNLGGVSGDSPFTSWTRDPKSLNDGQKRRGREALC